MQKPANYKRLLEMQNAKTTKGEALGYITGILYLAPANESGRANLCPFASVGCAHACLFRAGRGGMDGVYRARLKKTDYLLDHPEDFLNSLRWDIQMIARRAKKHGMKPAIRINGTSDMCKLAMQMAKEFPEINFYDYTKNPKPWLRQRPNYIVTFSRSETNEAACLAALQHGVNVAVVFDAKTAIKGRRKAEQLPNTWNGFDVIDGDAHDLRFLDPKGVVVGLREKKARERAHLQSGFVVPAKNFVSSIAAAV